MRLEINVLPFALACAFFATPALAQQATSHADHAAHARHAATAAEAPAQRWSTDAPLRAGMREIRAATAQLAQRRAGHLEAGQGTAAAARIDVAIRNMIANCKLDPQADAALHGLLAKFMAGADAARSGRFSPADLNSMQQALARYPELFDDPGWKGR